MESPQQFFKRAIVATGVAFALATTTVDAYVLLGASPGGRLTMNLAMQALIGNEAVSAAMSRWNQVGIGPGEDHAFFVAQTAGTSGSCGSNQINEVSASDTNCGLAFGDSTLAVTTIWSSAGKVVEVDLMFNNAKRWSSYGGPLMYNASGMVINDLNRVALHELGHAAGLDHPDEAGQSVGSIMNSHISDLYTLQADDIAGAHAIVWKATAAASTPVCTVSASPSSINSGGSTTLVASCVPAATSFVWTNTGFGSDTSAGVVAPSATTTYQVTGYNAQGAGNSARVTVTVAASLPDFEITLLIGPGNANAGAPVTVSAEVHNRGSGTNQAFRVGFYLARDKSVSPSDVLIGTCSFGSGMLAGQTSICSGQGNIPAGTAAGTYILRAVVDDTQAVDEKDETNNARMATPEVIYIFAKAVPVCTLTASPATIGVGGSTTLAVSCSPAATSYSWTNTGFAGTASGGVISPTVTTNYSVVGINEAGAGTQVNTTVVVTAESANYTDLWWAGSTENGWGLSIHQHGSKMFNTLYVYDGAGKPAWYVMPSGSWDSGATTFSGPVYQPTSAPLNSYTPANFVPGAAVGDVTIHFTGNSTAELRYTINGVSGQKSIQRQTFGNGRAPLNVGDMWWGGAAQDGWGISLTQQGGTLFGAWYTYGPDGRTIWYVLPNGTWNGATYSGSFYSTTGSPWLGRGYDANKLMVNEAGTMSLNFNSESSAVMTYTFISGPFAGTTQSRQILRQAF